MITDDGLDYVSKHFWPIELLADAVGASVARVRSLIEAGCAPGPIYVLGSDGWWSALERSERAAPSGRAWYSPGAAWTLRRATLAARKGFSDDEASTLLQETFCKRFAAALRAVPGAERRFEACFVDGVVSELAACSAASGEWRDWIGGGYAVCLRVFTARTCIEKEVIAANVKAALGSGRYDEDDLLDQIETLAGMILPFAPWQRANCTPGLTIDRLLMEQHLGFDPLNAT